VNGGGDKVSGRGALGAIALILGAVLLLIGLRFDARPAVYTGAAAVLFGALLVLRRKREPPYK